MLQISQIANLLPVKLEEVNALLNVIDTGSVSDETEKAELLSAVEIIKENMEGISLSLKDIQGIEDEADDALKTKINTAYSECVEQQTAASERYGELLVA